jgi:hypothetical protein
VVTTADAEPVRLRLPAPRRWGRGGLYAGLGLVGVVIGVVGGSEALANASSVTLVGKILFGVLGLVCVLLGLWLVRTGVNIARQRAGHLPVLLATGTAIRLERPGRKDREVVRARVAAATFEVPLPAREGETPLAYLEWLDADGRSIGTWTVDPVVGSGLPRFLRAIDVELRSEAGAGG